MKNVLCIPLLVAFLTPVSAPHQALAFESALPVAESRVFVAQVILKDRDSDLLITNEELPTASYAASAAAASYPSVLTETGRWPTRPKRIFTRYAQATLPGWGEPVVLQGEASYYSRAGCLGCDPQAIMANGQPLNDGALTMAIGAHLKHLVGHRAVVTNLVTNQSVEVLITDTGGFYQAKYGSRVADLTIATKEAIGIRGGLGQVRVEVR